MPRHTSGRRRRSRMPVPAALGREIGFTLVELLIGLVLVSLILVLLFGGLRLGSRSWEAVEGSVQRAEGERVARGFLQRALLQARKVDWALDNKRFVLFMGTTEQIEFVTPLSGYVGVSGLYLVRIVPLERDGKRDLVLQRWLVHPEVLAGGEGVPEWVPLESAAPVPGAADAPLGVYGTAVLLEDVGAVRFSYYGPQLEDPTEAWQDEWNERMELPRLVRIQLERDAKAWVELVVPLVNG